MKLRVFIGSSSERKNIAKTLSKLLRKKYEVVPWYKDVFWSGSSAWQDLETQANRAHLAILVYAPDDELTMRKQRYVQPRDNVIFELGMFMSKLGARACFLLVPSDLPGKPPLRIPSDLLGLTTLRYSQHDFDKFPELALRKAIAEFVRSHSNSNTNSGRRPKLAGRWKLTWIVESDRFKLLNEYELTLVQVGDRVLGKYQAQRKKGKAIPVELDGALKEHILTGEWTTNGYKGAFQLQVAKDWKSMTGRWIGPANSGGIKTGLYQWTRIAKSVSASSKGV